MLSGDPPVPPPLPHHGFLAGTGHGKAPRGSRIRPPARKFPPPGRLARPSSYEPPASSLVALATVSRPTAHATASYPALRDQPHPSTLAHAPHQLPADPAGRRPLDHAVPRFIQRSERPAPCFSPCRLQTLPCASER